MKYFLSISVLFVLLNTNIRAEGPMPLIGKGTYTFLFMSVYEARLWALNKDDLYSDRVTLELDYKMDLDGADIVNQTIKEFESTGVAADKATKWGSLLLPIFPNVKKGDSIMAKFNPAEGIKFYLNKEMLLGEVKSIDFSTSFLDIWLGPKSSDPNLRDLLRGVKND